MLNSLRPAGFAVCIPHIVYILYFKVLPMCLMAHTWNKKSDHQFYVLVNLLFHDNLTFKVWSYPLHSLFCFCFSRYHLIMGNVVKPKFHVEEEYCIEVIKQKEGGLIEVRRERKRVVAARDQGEKRCQQSKWVLKQIKPQEHLNLAEHHQVTTTKCRLKNIKRRSEIKCICGIYELLITIRLFYFGKNIENWTWNICIMWIEITLLYIEHLNV